MIKRTCEIKRTFFSSNENYCKRSILLKEISERLILLKEISERLTTCPDWNALF